MNRKSIELNLLSLLEEGKETSQKNISNNVSVSIGFINALIKKFVKKGVIKIQQAPYKRFIYYLTPQGFSEKAKLVNEYFRDSLTFFKSLRKEFNNLFKNDKSLEYFLYGTGEVCEIALLSAQENKKKISAIIDPGYKEKKYFNYKVLNKLPQKLFDKKIVITSPSNQQLLYYKLKKQLKDNQILYIKSMCISKKKPNYNPVSKLREKNE